MKYGEVTVTGKQLHPGEPVFLFRATDPLAPESIRDYADLCEDRGCSADHVYGVRAFAEQVETWQRSNPALVKKLPD